MTKLFRWRPRLSLAGRLHFVVLSYAGTAGLVAIAAAVLSPPVAQSPVLRPIVGVVAPAVEPLLPPPVDSTAAVGPGAAVGSGAAPGPGAAIGPGAAAGPAAAAAPSSAADPSTVFPKEVGVPSVVENAPEMGQAAGSAPVVSRSNTAAALGGRAPGRPPTAPLGSAPGAAAQEPAPPSDEATPVGLGGPPAGEAPIVLVPAGAPGVRRSGTGSSGSGGGSTSRPPPGPAAPTSPPPTPSPTTEPPGHSSPTPEPASPSPTPDASPPASPSATPA